MCFFFFMTTKLEKTHITKRDCNIRIYKRRLLDGHPVFQRLQEKVGDLEARWRKKLKTLELRFPLL